MADLVSKDGQRVVGSDRVLAVLVELANHPGGISLDGLSRQLASSKSTVHRALGALRRAGLAAQVDRGIYVVGDELYRLAFSSYSMRPETAVIQPVLERLCDRYNETAHYAVLDGTDVVYRAKVDPERGAVKLTSVVGGRNPAYCTAVGKLLLSRQVSTEDRLRAVMGDGPYEARTPNTIVGLRDLWAELCRVRERGYAVDDQENERGVNCVAVPSGLYSATGGEGAISISALAFRTPLAALTSEVPTILSLIPEFGRPASR